MTSAPSRSEAAGQYILSLIEAQLAEERASKKSLEERGITVITTVGAIVGLLFGLVAVITGVDNFRLPDESTSWLIWALAAMTVSAVGGLVVNIPMNYKEVDPMDLQRFADVGPNGKVTEFWAADGLVGSARVALVNAEMLEAARGKNKVKARILTLALAAEVVGVGLLAFAVGLIVRVNPL